MGMRPTDYDKTEEAQKLNELRKLDQGVADYIEITLDHVNGLCNELYQHWIVKPGLNDLKEF